MATSVLADEAARLDALRRAHADLAEREEALRENEERLRLALDAAHMGTFDWDVPHNRITWSRWHEELWGFKPGEFGGTYEAFSQRVHPEDLPDVNAEVARCLAARAPLAREFRVVWPDGSVHWVTARGEFTFGADGQPTRMRGAVLDTTVRRQAEERARKARQFLAQVIASAQEGIVVYGEDLRYQAWNPFMEQLTGVAAEAVLGKHPLDVFPFLQDNGVYAAVERARAGESISLADMPYRLEPTGRRGWVSPTVAPRQIRAAQQRADRSEANARRLHPKANG